MSNNLNDFKKVIKISEKLVDLISKKGSVTGIFVDKGMKRMKPEKGVGIF
jgi:hypothetical protein